MSDVTIYYNPGCTKCRLTKGLLEEKGIEPKVIEYLDTPPTLQDLEQVLSLLGVEPIDITRTGESLYKELGLDQKKLSREDHLKTLVENPMLIQRPIVIKDGKAVIGRPPEKVLEIL
jgi:arsenate reductase (glutaredoxin)